MISVTNHIGFCLRACKFLDVKGFNYSYGAVHQLKNYGCEFLCGKLM